MTEPKNQDIHYITGSIQTPVGAIPRLQTKLSLRDYCGTIKMRIGFGRDDYRVPPGLYGIGNPDEQSPVLVTANYKLTFDVVRRALKGRNLWLMIIDTKGINVWCAAGKGTFGTNEVVQRIFATQLANVVSHRTVILPQLAAPGVAAQDIKKKTGFRAVYGPVRIEDVGAFLDADMQATAEMRRVRSSTLDRLILTPVDLVIGWKLFLGLALVLLIIPGIPQKFAFPTTWDLAAPNLIALLGAIIAGAVITPTLLPWIPGRSFAFKGWLLGLVGAAILVFYWSQVGSVLPWSRVVGTLCLWPAFSAFLAMNYTGASTFTSPSGVRREMKYAVPAEAALALIGAVLLVL